MKREPTDKIKSSLIGANLRRMRKAAKISQTELGRRIGVTFQQVQKYELGQNRLSVDRMHDIHVVTGWPIIEMFTGMPTHEGCWGQVENKEEKTND